MFKILHDGETLWVNDLAGYETAQVLDANASPPDEDEVAADILTGDEIGTEIYVIDRLEQIAENMLADEEPRHRLQNMITTVWQECQLIKLANMIPGAIPADPLARAKMFPILTATNLQTGVPLATIVSIIENRYWDKVRRMALWTGKMLAAVETALSAPTAQGKIDALRNVEWTE